MTRWQRTAVALLGVAALLSCQCTLAQERPFSSLVKYTRDSADRIVGMELPKGATTAQFEALEIPASLKSFVARESRLSKGALRSLARKCSLSSLDVSDSPVDESFAAALSEMTTLESLDLSGTNCNDALAALSLPKLEHLVRLDLSRTKITNRALQSIAALDSLEELSIAHCKVSPRSAEFLTGQPGLSEIGRLRKLQSLDLTGLVIDDADAKDLCAFATLRALKVQYGQGCAITPRGWEVVHEHNPRLRIGVFICQSIYSRYKTDQSGPVIELSRIDYDDLRYFPEGELASIRRLVVRNAARLAVLSHCSSLESLTISNSRMDESDVAVLATLPKLVDLRLSKMTVPDDAFARLLALATLKSIVLEAPPPELLAYVERFPDKRVRIEKAAGAPRR